MRPAAILVQVTVGVTCTGGDPESDSESAGESNICLLEKWSWEWRLVMAAVGNSCSRVEAWLVLGVWKALDSSWERHTNECQAKAGKVVKEYAGKKLEWHATNRSRQQSGRE